MTNLISPFLLDVFEKQFSPPQSIKNQDELRESNLDVKADSGVVVRVRINVNSYTYTLLVGDSLLNRIGGSYRGSVVSHLNGRKFTILGGYAERSSSGVLAGS